MNSQDPTISLACALIERPSITPKDEGCQELLMERLQAIGFECVPLPFGATSNFWAEYTAPGDDGPLLVFAGHTDVVPPGPESEWRSPPFEAHIRDGLLYGRGAADMKGSLAAMITACEQALASGRRLVGRIGFLITSDEEGPATDGTVKVVEWLASRGTIIDYCVVGEPSSADRLGDTLRIGRRGSLNGSAIVRGLQGHVAYPQLADNPIHKALPALQELQAHSWDEGNAAFPPSSFQLTNIESGTGASNVIPGELTCSFNFRFNTEQNADGLQEAVLAAFARHGLDAAFDWQLSGEPFLTEEGALIAACEQVVKIQTGLTPERSTGGGTSDGRFIAPTGAEVVELGPINASIHKVNEHVATEDLQKLSSIYTELILTLLAEQ
ncbi:MAG: succinyl-diaminopimelate desuccinylase [Pseudomonadota bacterium]